MEYDFKNILKVSLYAMTLNRTHPEIPRNLKWLLEFLILHGLFTITVVFIVYNIFCIDLKNNDFSQACRNAILFLTYSGVTMTYFIMLWHQRLFVNIMESMKRDLENAKLLPPDEQRIISEYAVKEIWFCKVWLGLCLYSCAIFHLKAIFLNVYYYVIGDCRVVSLCDLVYTSYIEAKKDTVSMYIIIYLVLSYYGIYGIIMYIAFVPMGPVFMLHASGQMELVKKRIESLFVYKHIPDDEVNKKIKDIVIQLQNIYNFVDSVKTTLKVFYEATLKVSTFVLPITFYELIDSFHEGRPNFEFSSFLLSSLIISSAPCYYGDLLLEKAEEVRLAVYSCGWERRHVRCARASLLIVLTRALRPVAIRTLFRTLCLDALTDVFQQAYAIFSLMNAVMT